MSSSEFPFANSFPQVEVDRVGSKLCIIKHSSLVLLLSCILQTAKVMYMRTLLIYAPRQYTRTHSTYVIKREICAPNKVSVLWAWNGCVLVVVIVSLKLSKNSWY